MFFLNWLFVSLAWVIVVSALSSHPMMGYYHIFLPSTHANRSPIVDEQFSLIQQHILPHTTRLHVTVVFDGDRRQLSLPFVDGDANGVVSVTYRSKGFEELTIDKVSLVCLVCVRAVFFFPHGPQTSCTTTRYELTLIKHALHWCITCIRRAPIMTMTKIERFATGA